ncbi:50S ribosomal protein L23 [Buchnera aphidicola]|uniref:50S ribosomal protein L23 n=1 Tax=Buchnera aphidicola TaxID=9 RepID=UPI0022388B97|nr:50S ribosomal protein L23 [Buchnera aphidicola]MCW5197482.1 50S ribosomal protein L23 [Buchnera aphidicola (Chaitophorus viminalis)]
MLKQNFLFQTIQSIYVSEKSNQSKENNVLVLKVDKKATKKEIKISVEEMFKLKVRKVNLLNVKGKKKNKGKNIFFKKNWKKAYVFLNSNQNLDFLNNSA